MKIHQHAIKVNRNCCFVIHIIYLYTHQPTLNELSGTNGANLNMNGTHR